MTTVIDQKTSEDVLIEYPKTEYEKHDIVRTDGALDEVPASDRRQRRKRQPEAADTLDDDRRCRARDRPPRRP